MIKDILEIAGFVFEFTGILVFGVVLLIAVTTSIYN